MKTYKISIIKNLKNGFLTIPFGIATLFVDYVIIQSGFISWMSILLFISISLIGFPGILIHLYYLIHDLRTGIKYNTHSNYFDFLKNGKSTRIYKKDVESLDKITKDGTGGRIPWGEYKMFRIKMKNGDVFSITNLTIDFDELFEIVKTKDRQINTYCKFRLF